MSDERRFRVVVVEDEEPSRRKLRGLIALHPELELVGECGCAVEALRAIRTLEPELVFLDVQLPDLDGFEIVELTSQAALRSLIVFVTAYERFAHRAFEIGAADYLLKPVDPDRFARAVARATGQLEARVAFEPAERGAGAPLRRLLARDGARWVVVPVDAVACFEGDGNYVLCRCAEGVYRVRATLSTLEQELDTGRFFRIHRSTIVNLDAVRDLAHVIHGDYLVRLRDGTEATLTGARRDAFVQALAGRKSGDGSRYSGAAPLPAPGADRAS
jgi:two-component system LytT family response regulator